MEVVEVSKTKYQFLPRATVPTTLAWDEIQKPLRMLLEDQDSYHRGLKKRPVPLKRVSRLSKLRTEWRARLRDWISSEVGEQWSTDIMALDIPLHNVEVVRIPGKLIEVIHGCIFEASLMSRHMRTRIINPRVLLLSGSLAYKDNSNLNNAVMEDRAEFFAHLAALIKERKADVVISSLAIPGELTRIVTPAISCIQNVETSTIARLESLTCTRSVSLFDLLARRGETPSFSEFIVEGYWVNKKLDSYIILTGEGTEYTIRHNGDHHITTSLSRYLVNMRNLQYESAWMLDQCSNLTEDSTLSPVITQWDDCVFAVTRTITGDQSANCFWSQISESSFYASADIGIGDFLFQTFFGPAMEDQTCPTCFKPSHEHRYIVTSETGRVKFEMNMLPGQILVDSNEQHSRIITWSRCLICGEKVTPFCEMTQDSYNMSLTRLILLITGSERDQTVCFARNCRHSVYTQHYRYFAHRNMIISMCFEPIVPFTLKLVACLTPSETYVASARDMLFETLNDLDNWIDENSKTAPLYDLQCTVLASRERAPTHKSVLRLTQEYSILKAAIPSVDWCLELNILPFELQVENALFTESYWDIPPIAGGGDALVIPCRLSSTSSIVAHTLGSPAFLNFIHGSFDSSLSPEELLSQENTLSNTSPKNFRNELRMGNELAKITVYFAQQFYSIRQLFCNRDIEFIEALMDCRDWSSSGGKSSAGFGKTACGRFIVKYLSDRELRMFSHAAPKYFSYMRENLVGKVPSTLIPCLGIFRVVTSFFDERIMVMPNLLHQHDVTKVFDLKGKSSGRVARTSEAVLLDLNFVHYTEGMPLSLKPDARDWLAIALKKDTDFLAEVGIMDYSLLVGIGTDDSNPILVMGIIDYIHRYTFDKAIESNFKSVFVSQDPTILNPVKYKSRFMETMRTYFLF